MVIGVPRSAASRNGLARSRAPDSVMKATRKRISKASAIAARRYLKRESPGPLMALFTRYGSGSHRVIFAHALHCYPLLLWLSILSSFSTGGNREHSMLI